MTSRIGTIALDAREPRVVAAFWCAVLGFEVLEEEEGILTLGAPGAGLEIDVVPVPEAKTVKNRLHLDLRADGSSTAEELERLLALGAVRVDVGQGPDVPWTVLADPEGNEFCLLPRSIQDVAAGR